MPDFVGSMSTVINASFSNIQTLLLQYSNVFTVKGGYDLLVLYNIVFPEDGKRVLPCTACTPTSGTI
jgi:hypothetical protein